MTETMTSGARLWAALNQEQPDRVPIWMLYPREQYGSYVDVYNLPSYKRIIPVIREQTDWLDRRNLGAPPFYTAAAVIDTEVDHRDGWTITRRILHTPAGDLVSEHRQDEENAAGARTEHYCKTIEDLEKVLTIPYEPVDPDMRAFKEAEAKLTQEDGLMMVNIGMPIGAAYGLTHPENFAIWSLTERERLVQFTQEIFEREYAFLEKALKAGAGPVFFAVGTEFVAPPMCSPQAFESLITPFDKPIFELIHQYGGKVIVHHHGNISSILDHIADLGADGIQPIEEPPIGDCTMAEAKARIGDRVCLVGSVQYDDFARLTPDAMEALVKRQIGDAAPGGGMILAPTAGPYATYLSERQQENTLRFIEAGKRWGKYPLSWT
jgi:uroporphyrinogen-III decarboxylase